MWEEDWEEGNECRGRGRDVRLGRDGGWSGWALSRWVFGGAGRRGESWRLCRRQRMWWGGTAKLRGDVCCSTPLRSLEGPLVMESKLINGSPS